MKRSRWISLVVQRVLITVAVFLAAMLVIYFTAINPKEIFSPCDRPCKRADWPRICRYRLVIEKRLMPKSLLAVDHKNIIRTTGDQAAATGGHLAWQQRHYFLVNGRHTGPTLAVCERDFIVIDIVNRIPGQSIAIHWTGQSQRRTPFMDGVPMITQCPIASFTTFQYKFQADRVGTHLYHGFAADERSLGLVGALVVRSEHEQRFHPVTASCHQRRELVWIIAETGFGAVSINERSSFVQQVRSGLRYRLRVGFVSPFKTLPEGCQHWLEIEQHRLTVIALDGNLLEPVPVERVALSDGDRIDLILGTTLKEEDGGDGQEYEIRLVRATSHNGSCEQEHLRFASSSSRFKLRYVGTKTAGTQIMTKKPDDGDDARAPAIADEGGLHRKWQEQNNTVKSSDIDRHPRGFNAGRLICDVAAERGQISPGQIYLLGEDEASDVHRGQSWDHFPEALRDVDRRIKLVLAKRIVQREILGELFQDISYSVNGFSFVFPTVVMLRKLLPAIRRTGSRPAGAKSVGQDELLRQLYTCSGNGTGADAGNTGTGAGWMPKKCHQLPPDETCECVHVEHVQAGHRVELVLINEDPDSDHSYHLHGHSFYIVGAARFDKGSQHQEQFQRNFDRPVRRDTVRIERRSLVVLRFVATHAGLWLMRDLGAENGWSRGLDVLLVVHGRSGKWSAEDEFDIPRDFPTCDSFVGPKYFMI